MPDTQLLPIGAIEIDVVVRRVDVVNGRRDGCVNALIGGIVRVTRLRASSDGQHFVSRFASS